MFIYMGARIGYWRGDIKGLVDDIGGSPHDGVLSLQHVQQETCRLSLQPALSIGPPPCVWMKAA